MWYSVYNPCGIGKLCLLDPLFLLEGRASANNSVWSPVCLSCIHGAQLTCSLAPPFPPPPPFHSRTATNHHHHHQSWPPPLPIFQHCIIILIRAHFDNIHTSGEITKFILTFHLGIIGVNNSGQFVLEINKISLKKGRADPRPADRTPPLDLPLSNAHALNSRVNCHCSWWCFIFHHKNGPPCQGSIWKISFWRGKL